MIRRCRLIFAALRNQYSIVLCRRKRVKREGGGGEEDDDVDFEYNEIDDDGDDFEFVPDAEQQSATEAKKGQLRSDLHVIYRRKNSHLEHSSDYRKSQKRFEGLANVKKGRSLRGTRLTVPDLEQGGPSSPRLG